jgi:hypothetical protein
MLHDSRKASVSAARCGGGKSKKNWARKGPKYDAHQGESSALLARGLLRNRTAKLQGPILLATACDESNNGAKHRHNCDLLGHGLTPVLASVRSIVLIAGRAPQD